MKLTTISKALLGALALLGMASAANATLILRPTTDGVFSSGASSCDKACVESKFGATNISLLYQANDGGSESGEDRYERAYDTDFEDDDTNAEIDYDDGSDIDCGNCYLVIRRDDNDGYYFFDLGNFLRDGHWTHWNGTETIEWRGSTEIDRVQIYGGGSKVSVPEPTTLSVFGLTLLAFGLVRRRKRS
jgi:hypothetical protein